MDLNDPLSTFENLKIGYQLLKEALSMAKSVKDVLPEGDQKDSVQKSLEGAERATKLAEAQMAQGLGYSLCRCTFPPQIMLSIGVDDEQCPNCKKTLSDRISAIQKVEKDWDPWN